MDVQSILVKLKYNVICLAHLLSLRRQNVDLRKKSAARQKRKWKLLRNRKFFFSHSENCKNISNESNGHDN